MAFCFDRRTKVLALLCVATLLLNAPELGRVFRLDFHISHIGMHPRLSVFALSRDSNFTFETALCRLLAEHVAPGDEVLFVSSGDAREASAERALCQAATWVTMPAPVIGIREQGLGIRQ